MGKKSRTKGRRLEQELCQLLRVIWPDVARNLQQWARSDGRDLDSTPGFCWQAKGGKRPNWRTGYFEADDSREDEEIAVCATRQDREEWFVHLSLTDFLALLIKAGEGTEVTIEPAEEKNP